MKKNKVFVLGMLAALLAFGLILAGCENDTSDSTAEKTLVITNVPANLLTGSVQIGILPAGETSQSAAVAGADTSGGAIQVSGSTVTVSLYDAASGYSNRWTGSGTYDVYLIVDSTYYKASDVSFSSATTTLSATNDFS